MTAANANVSESISKKDIMNAVSAANMFAMSRVPFFGALLLSTRLEYSEDLPAVAATDGMVVYFNPKIIPSVVDGLMAQSRNMDRESALFWTVLFLLVHEILHCAFMHTTRCGERNQFVFNVACDIVINNMIVRQIFRDSPRVPGLCYGEDLGLSAEDNHAEAVYDLLMSRKAEVTHDHDSGTITISITDDSGRKKFSKTYKDLDSSLNSGKYSDPELRDHWERQIENAKTTAERIGAGTESDSIITELKKLYEPKLDWRTVVRYWNSEICKDDYSWNRRSRRSVATPFYFPAVYSKKPKIVVAVDASGSVSDKEFTEFLSEIFGILSQTNCQVRLVMFDGGITYSETIDSPSGLELKRHGCGGTLFGPVFDHIEALQEKPDGLVVFTDGGNFDRGFEDKVNAYFPVLWIINTDMEGPRIGRTIKYER